MAATIEPPCRRLFAVESKQNLSNLESKLSLYIVLYNLF